MKKYLVARRHAQREQMRQLEEVYKEKNFCHPRWCGEEMFLAQEEATVLKRFTTDFWTDGWNYIEAICLVMACIQTALTIALFLHHENAHLTKALMYYSSAFTLVVWLRLNRCLRSNHTIGPFIAMLEECVIVLERFAFLFLDFYIPFACAFWVLFGRDQMGKEY